MNDLSRSSFFDPDRDYEYEPPPGLERPPLPQVLFDLEKPTFNDFWKIVKRKRNSSDQPWQKWEFLCCLQIKQKNSVFTVGITLLYLGKV